MACIWRHGHKIEDYVDKKYLIDSYMLTYAPMINPLLGQNEWIKSGEPPLKPSVYKKQPGRPKKVRARDATEPKKPPTNPTKLQKYDVSMTCKKFGVKGHNSRTCGKVKTTNVEYKKRQREAERHNSSNIQQKKVKKPRVTMRQSLDKRRHSQPYPIDRPLASSQPVPPMNVLTPLTPTMSQPNQTCNSTREIPNKRVKSPAKRKQNPPTSQVTSNVPSSSAQANGIRKMKTKSPTKKNPL